jgi:HEAT repeat protein
MEKIVMLRRVPQNPMLVVGLLGLTIAGVAPCAAETGQQKAWVMFEDAAKSPKVSERSIGIAALGLLANDRHGRELAENALTDPRPEVRAAAATALGQMRAVESVPKLKKSLKDKRMAVVMAAARALRDLRDKPAAYALYYEVLTGERRGDGLIAEQLDTLHDPKELAKIGFEEGIGYIPFAGIGWDAWRYTHKGNPHPPRAIAATLLAHDPNPATGKALAKAAASDKDWIVRAAAVESLAQRGDPAFEDNLMLCFFDSNAHVRYTAAAAVIRLSEIQRKRAEKQAAKSAAGELSRP